MRSTRRLLEVQGVSHSALQKYPHPDLDYETESNINSPHCAQQRGREFSSNSGIRPTSKCSNINSEVLLHDNLSKRTQSLQTVFSYQTDSSCSWSDENEKEYTIRTQTKLEESENRLFDNSLDADQLSTEDVWWRERFIYLRVVGKQITPFINITRCDNSDLSKVPLEHETADIEEVIEENGINESRISESIEATEEGTLMKQNTHEIKERVIERLTEHLALKVVEWLAALEESQRKSTAGRIRSSVTRLPPLTTYSPSRSPILRPTTGLQQKRKALVQPSKTSTDSEAHLQGLLTISSKVLQNRFQDKTTDRWYPEILPSQEIPNSRKTSAASVDSFPKQNQDDFLYYKNIRDENVKEDQNNVSLPKIHQRMNSGLSPQITKTGKNASYHSQSFHRHRLLTTSNKNLPFLKQELGAGKRVSSALPSKMKAGTSGKQPAPVTRSYIAEKLQDSFLQMPFNLKNTETEKHIILSPFTLLPIVKSLTPLTSISRPKSKSDKRKVSAQTQD